MIPVSNEMKQAFRNDAARKYYYIQFVTLKEDKSKSQITADYDKTKTPPSGHPTGYIEEDDTGKEEIITLDNQYISSESLRIVETLCSEEQLHYGAIEAASVEFEINDHLFSQNRCIEKDDGSLYFYESLHDVIFDLYLKLEGCEDILTVGRYIIDEEKCSNDKKTTEITAYDVLYILRDLDVTYWYYYEISFPCTLKQMRDSLFEYVGNQQEETSLICDDIVIPVGPLDGENYITFANVMESICEINGTFGHIGRSGIFEYVSLDFVDMEELYPNYDTYPGKDTYPNSVKDRYYNYPKSLIKYDMWWENYKCQPIDRVQGRGKSGEALKDYAIPGRENGSNIYVIQGNWVLYELDESTVEEVLRRFANKIKDVSYTPVEIEAKMDLSMEVGDPITFLTTENRRISTYILQREMNGIQSAFDTIESTGYEEFVNDNPSTDGAISQLQDDLLDLSDRVDDIDSKYSNIRVISTKVLPASPERNVIYLIQGTVYIK